VSFDDDRRCVGNHEVFPTGWDAFVRPQPDEFEASGGRGHAAEDWGVRARLRRVFRHGRERGPRKSRVGRPEGGQLS
jgi:hypothetical protein